MAVFIFTLDLLQFLTLDEKTWDKGTFICGHMAKCYFLVPRMALLVCQDLKIQYINHFNREEICFIWTLCLLSIFVNSMFSLSSLIS